MITPFDDYPIHQTALPVAQPASGDRNHYDRTFFNGYARDGSAFFAFTMAVYPNRRVIDAAFTVVHDGVQRSVFASGRAPDDRTRTRVGPIALEVAEPLRVSRVRVAAAHLGIEAELGWEARTPAVAEPRQTIADGAVTILDATRLVQWGTWTGAVEVAGARIPLDGVPGTKDRSWGVRPVGEPPGGAPGSGLVGGGVFMLWAPLHFDDRCTHLILFEQPDGRRWYSSALDVPVLEPGARAWGADRARHAHGADYEIAYEPGTRRARAASLTYRWPEPETVTLEPLARLYTKGLGYFHPTWAHGVWHGEEAEGADEWKLDEVDPADPTLFHVEQVVRARAGDRTGIGVLEQLVLGPHAPTGLTGYTDGG